MQGGANVPTTKVNAALGVRCLIKQEEEKLTSSAQSFTLLDVDPLAIAVDDEFEEEEDSSQGGGVWLLVAIISILLNVLLFASILWVVWQKVRCGKRSAVSGPPSPPKSVPTRTLSSRWSKNMVELVEEVSPMAEDGLVLEDRDAQLPRHPQPQPQPEGAIAA